MEQIVDLENSSDFNNLNVSLVNLATDPASVLGPSGDAYGITTPLLTDPEKSVSEAYGVMRWATPGGEPSHTFILLDKDGKVLWIQDYGHSSNGGRMYIPLPELLGEIQSHLQ